MKTLYRRSSSSVNVARLFSALILASLLLSVLPALSPPGIGAQDDGATTPAAEVQEADAQESEATTPTPQAQEDAETPPPEPTGTSESQPETQANAVTAYIAEVRACPPGFDPSAGDASAALASCVEPLTGVAFTLGTQNPNYPGDTRTTGGDGIAVWPDIPLGTGYSVTESTPQGSADPWVYCEVTGGPGADQYSFFAAVGGTMDVGLSNPNLANYAQTYCRWFNFSSGDPAVAVTPDGNIAAGAGEVHLTNYLCPVNLNTADSTLGALKAACTTAGEGFSFTLKASTGGPQTATTNAQGVVVWTDVPSGQLTITESIPEGIRYAQPYCSVAPVGNGPGSPDSSLVQSDGKTIKGGIAPGQALHCELFNVPMPESTLAIIPFLCPSDFPGSDMTLHALTVGCSIPGLNIEFTVTTVEGEQLTGNTGTNGFIEWKNLTSGTVKIAQTPPTGYLAGPTYCDPAPPAGELDGSNWQSPTYENDVISFDIPDRYTLNCVSFYVEGTQPTVEPAGIGSGSVIVQGYVCADELYDPAVTLQGYLDLCQTPHDGGKVRLFSAESGADLTAEITGGAPLSFPDVPPGETELNFLSGSIQNRLFCTTYPHGEASPPVSTYAESSVSLDIEGGYEVSCYWFNFQELPDDAYVTITIEKHLCGPEYPDSSMVEDWRQACPDPHAGITFDVMQSGVVTATGTTGADGRVTLRALPGNLDLLEGQPDAFPGGYAWCGTQVAGGQPTYVNAGRLNPGDPNMPLANVTPELRYICEWFNAPLETMTKEAGDGGDVVVIKWRCPEGYDASSATLEQLREACPTPQEGVTIGVYYPSGTPFTELTRLEKGPAVARFDGLPPGKVGIGEAGPSGHELQRAFCRTSDAGPGGPAVSGGFVEQTVSGGYVEQTVADGGVAAELVAGKVIECQFFNVPTGEADAPPSAGMVYVDKRSCPPGFGAVRSSYVDIAMYCTAEPGVEFKVTYGETTISAITGGDGIATFTDVPAGIFRISELPREGYDPPQVFCRFTLEGAGSTGTLDPVTVDNWSAPSKLPEGYFMECVWANMPAATTSTDPGTVVLHANICPEGTGEYASLEALLGACDSPAEGMKFTAGVPLDKPVGAVTDDRGKVTFTDVAPGFNRVEQVDGQGFRAIAAWCDYFPSATGSFSDFAGHTAEPLSVYMSGGYTMECYWFAVPYVAPVTITIYERLCPATYGLAGASREDIIFNCTESSSGIDFQLRQASVVMLAESDSAAYDVTKTTDASGSVIYDDVPWFPLGIFELSPKYETARVFCGQAAAGELPTSYTEVAISDESILYEAQPGADVVCHWINVEVPPVEVRINVSSCLPYYEFYAADLDYLALNCTPEAGVDVQIVAGDAYTETVATSVYGLAAFQKIPPSSLVITESSPDLRTVRVFCGTQTSGYNSVEFSSDTVEYQVASGEPATCYWYTIETNYARVTVYKYACPEGYLAAGQTYDATLLACPTPLPGVRFDFDTSGQNYDITDDEGVAGSNELTPGLMTIVETAPPDYSGAIVFCRDIDPSQPEPDFAQVPVENLAIEREVVGGNELECHWFNTTTTYARAAVHKFGCHEGYVPQGRTYEDVLEECPTPLEGVTFTLGAPAAELSRETDASGTVVWEELAPGPLFISETPPDGYSDAIVFCAAFPEGTPATGFAQVPVEQLAIEHEVGAGETLACFWFNYSHPSDPDQPSPTPTQTPVPGTGNPSGQPGAPTPSSTPDPDAPATLILTTYLCPEGYDVYEAEADLAKDCDEATPGIEVSISLLEEDTASVAPADVATTDDDGVVTFSGLEPGLWLLTEALPETMETAFIASCTSDQRDLQEEPFLTPLTYLGPDGQIGIGLIAGETLACDSYAILEETDDK